MATMRPPLEGAIEIKPDEFARIVDSAAWYFLKMSGDEFVRKWQAGEFPDPDSIPGVMEVLSLLPAYQS
jgi:hypothetical protein